MEEVGTKLCIRCRQEKPITEFYIRRNEKDGHQPICAQCSREEVKRRRDDGRKNVPPKSTTEAARILTEMGIPVYPGKGAGMPHKDLVAFGCVPIEAKGAEGHLRSGKRHYNFGFTHKQKEESEMDGVIIFFAFYKDEAPRIFILPRNHPLIANSRERFTFTIDSGRKGSELWGEVQKYENAFDIIYQSFLDKIGYQFANWLRETYLRIPFEREGAMEELVLA